MAATVDVSALLAEAMGGRPTRPMITEGVGDAHPLADPQGRMCRICEDVATRYVHVDGAVDLYRCEDHLEATVATVREVVR